ncbi:OprO/OprP family phosphate-selective porin [Methylophilaceae bacterium]|jgi:hypothetical protein|nr:OprO/OprP family phosphate-selective porin [Methylophilaceae bacterium]
MNKKAILLAALLSTSLVATAAPSNQEIMDMMMELKTELAKLKDENTQLKNEVEDVAVATDEAIKAQVKLSNKTTIGGYGELHANWLEDKKGTKDTDKIDFHRFVLFVNHEYSDKLRFVSELELEHSIAGEGKAGEIELEQAYIEYDYNDKTSISAGLMILPVGILNETHEPNTFYGVERNPVEKNIIPATWWEGGAMIAHQLDEGLELKVLAHSGLKATSSFKPRDGRQKVGSASAEHLAYTAALKYTKIPGLTLGGAVNFQSDFSNGEAAGEQVGAGSAIMSEGHMVYEKGNFGLRALYARWDINGADVNAAGRDKQDGWYVEPSLQVTEEVGIFTRFSKYDNGAEASKGSSAIKQLDLGVNWWIDPQVVVKADYQVQSVGSAISNEYNGLNLGIGYAF